jgi:hypothetical protein
MLNTAFTGDTAPIADLIGDVVDALPGPVAAGQ